MPSGVYPHTSLKQRDSARKNFEKGRKDPIARAKALESLRKNGQRPKFREKMRRIANKLLKDPEVQARHEKGLKEFLKYNPPNFKGGNGQEPLEFIKKIEKILKPLGYERECPILTKGHTTTHSVPPCYKVDFGNRKIQHAIELDGPAHRRMVQEAIDKKKDEVLISLGWHVTRIKHR